MAEQILKRVVPVVLPLLFLISLAVFLATQMSFAPADRILPGVYMLSINLSLLDYPQAVSALKKLEQDMQKPLTVKYQGKSWLLPMDRVGLKLNCQQEARRAINIGRSGPLWQRFCERRQAYRGIRLEPEIIIDTGLLQQQVSQTAKDIILPPRDAGLIINNDDTVEISPAQSGREIDIQQLRQDIRERLLQQDTSPIELKPVEIPPARTTEEVQAMGVDTLLGMFSTQFDPNNVNRAYNISVAAAALDGLSIRPQEIVSFNEVVGPRSTEAGYKNAPIIINNELVDGLGGGVCQVSSTLYNAVLLANLEVTERANHSLPVPYVPIGRDATVVFDAVDLKFKNNTDYWLYLQSFVTGGRLTVKIFGNHRFKRDVVIRSWVEETYPPRTVVEKDYSLRLGDRVVKQKGAQGYRAASERIVMQDGKVIKVEKLPYSVYKARHQIISQGMAPPASLVKNPDPPGEAVEQDRGNPDVLP
ncbi:VanW family protein [Desulforamulus hydrothermalis]|uniref:VanW family protein n=1 Tax=Desulforamulus hydrothermalis Lam5 = DSM 18033 TaxID=1121428 RepID=K8E025_9FIRM|nr:VanW family protein [Desulforamulus hydrothermalis]CCO08814.1 VanW family protein [Desulforamulus hydrothermalis Lam5 = DSM 18033]SHG72251.1 Vancomycin resistance protein YoaR, contains peptidoglycan-binding and VanW domains [Desulforamulus hydrothermalis Lam5 = DSM 18033]